MTTTATTVRQSERDFRDGFQQGAAKVVDAIITEGASLFDVADWLRRDVQEWRNDAALYGATDAAPAPDPLASGDRSEGYCPFPVDLLPDPLRSLVEVGSESMVCDPAYVALPLLVSVAAAIGTTRAIELKRSWRESPILWAMIVGDSGTLKTPAAELALEPLRQQQEQMFSRNVTAAAEHERAVELYQTALAAWRREGAEGAPPAKPTPPAMERCIVDDATIEALAMILRDNPRGVAVLRDELAGWFLSFDRYSKGGGDEQRWLELFNGRGMTIDRKSSLMPVVVKRAAVSIFGGIQPGVLQKVLDPNRRASGMAARFLMAMPPRRPKVWTDADVPDEVRIRTAGLFESLFELKHDCGLLGGPVALPMTSSAKARWVAFYNEHGQEQASLSGDLAAVWSKLEGYAAKLSLMMHCVRVAAGDRSVESAYEVDRDSIERGIALTRWFADEALRVYRLFGIQPGGHRVELEREEAAKLVELIARHGGTIAPWELTRATRQYPTTKAAEGVLQALQAMGLGRFETRHPSSRGGRPSRVFKLA